MSIKALIGRRELESLLKESKFTSLALTPAPILPTSPYSSRRTSSIRTIVVESVGVLILLEVLCSLALAVLGMTFSTDSTYGGILPTIPKMLSYTQAYFAPLVVLVYALWRFVHGDPR